MHTGAVVDDPWNEELVRVGNMVFPNAEVRPDPRSQDCPDLPDDSLELDHA